MSEQDDTFPGQEVEVQHLEVETQKCGKMHVYVQAHRFSIIRNGLSVSLAAGLLRIYEPRHSREGDLTNVEKKAIFLTVHDIGSNHSTFQDFVEHPCMSEIKPRSVFIHVDVPGQEDNADELAAEYQFPTIQMLGEDLVCVLDKLKVKLVVGFGEGAGANILVRFALAHPSRVLGLILIHCVASGVGVMEYFKDKFMNWKLSNIGMNPSAEQYLVLHKFGAQLETVENKETLIQDYTEKLKNKINAKNLRRYVEAYMNRKDITSAIETNLKSMDVMLVSGGRAAHLQAVQNLYGRMDKQKTSFLKLDSVGDVFAQAPEKLAQSLLLFVKGLGYLTSVTMPGVERQRTFSGGDPKSLGAIGRRRTLSMEEYDMPRPRRLSLTIPQK